MLFNGTTFIAVVLLCDILQIAFGGCCPNGCSGHGACNSDHCQCYPNWQSGEVNSEDGDCAERSCPFEIAWADGPNSVGKHHHYAECANKGVCDRLLGECICFSGYEGKGCGRMSCPDDCSGHGRCLFANDIPFGVNKGSLISSDTENALGEINGNDAMTYEYYNWDANRSRLCACDPGYEGVSCDKRSCPKGPDVMGDGTKIQSQIIVIVPPTIGSTALYVPGTQFALSFTTLTHERFTTNPISLEAGIAEAMSVDGVLLNLERDVKIALESLPGRVIDEVTVSVTVLASSGYKITVDFSGINVQGPQNLLEVEWKPCGAGCNPYMNTGIPENALALKTADANIPTPYKYAHVEEYVPAIALDPAQTCGGRGKCDYIAGQCKCFSGYYGIHCQEQTALI